MKTISLCAYKCFNATCTSAWWEMSFVLLGCMESSDNSVADGECGATAQPCPSLFPPQKLPNADTHWYFTALALVRLSKSQDAFSLQTHDDKQEEKNAIFFFNVQPCVTASTERVMDVKTTCLQTKNCNEIIFTLGKRGN